MTCPRLPHGCPTLLALVCTRDPLLRGARCTCTIGVIITTEGDHMITVACRCGWTRLIAIPADCDPADPTDVHDVEVQAMMNHAGSTATVAHALITPERI